jgi:Tol biopolymer transport system component
MTNLTNNAADGDRAAAPVWSPDGSRIAFLQTDWETTFKDGPTDIRVIDPTGGSSTLILTIADGETIGSKMTWSPDGTRIMFRAVIAGQHGNYIIGADGTDLTLVAGIWPPGDPDWSP